MSYGRMTSAGFRGMGDLIVQRIPIVTRYAVTARHNPGMRALYGVQGLGWSGHGLPGLAWSGRGLPGLGVLNYTDLIAQAGLQNCSPLDSACVSNNAAKQAAVEDYWVQHEATGVPDGTQLNFTPQTTAEVNQFIDTANPAAGGNVVNDTGIMTITSPAGVTTAPPPPLPPIIKAPPVVPVANASIPIPKSYVPPQTQAAGANTQTTKAPGAPAGPSAPPPGTPGGATVVNSSGLVLPLTSSGGCFSFGDWDTTSCLGPASLLTWGIAVAAGVALFAFGGRRGR